MLTALTATFQISFSDVLLPKPTVYVPPLGSPVVTYHPVTISLIGIKAGDSILGLTTLPTAGKFYIISVNDDQLVIQNTSTMYDQTLSGPAIVHRGVEPLKYYDVLTDANGYITIAHELNRNPDKWLATSSVGPNQEPVVLNFVSSDTNNLTLRAFSNNSPLVSSSIKISLLLN